LSARHLGSKPEPHPLDYLQLWHGDADLLRASLEAVQQTAVVILEGIAPERPRLERLENVCY